MRCSVTWRVSRSSTQDQQSRKRARCTTPFRVILKQALSRLGTIAEGLEVTLEREKCWLGGAFAAASRMPAPQSTRDDARRLQAQAHRRQDRLQVGPSEMGVMVSDSDAT
eukprot:307494-Rhodomonas_salina.4